MAKKEWLLQIAAKITVVEYFNIIIETNNFLPDQEVNGM